MLRNIVDLPARGDDFYDREDSIAMIWDRLEAGNILLAAPRRFGRLQGSINLFDLKKPGPQGQVRDNWLCR